MTDLLLAYGFPRDLLPPAGSQARPARVTAVFKERFQLMTQDGERYGSLKTKEYLYDGGQAFPTTGDYVLALPAPGGWQIVRTLPRRSFFSRLDSWHGTEQAVAANMDVVFAVQSLNENFNLNRLERYLTLSWNSGAKPVVVLTKLDLPGEHEEQIAAAQRAAGTAPVIALSSKTGQGMDQLLPYLAPGSTAAFLGSSGVGKSSLINRLGSLDAALPGSPDGEAPPPAFPQKRMATASVREKDGMGRHTTTYRQLLRLPGGALVIDTPGMRELGMWDSLEGLGEAFPDVERYLGRCRFSDCRHENEPGCAILAAIAQGELSVERWKSYRQLREESRRGPRKKQGQPSKALARAQRQEKKYRKKFPEQY